MGRVRGWIETVLIEKSAVMRDDQRRAVEALEPVFQPFEHGDVKVVGGFIEQQQVGGLEQQPRQQEARLLPAAQFADAVVRGDVCQAERGEDVCGLKVGRRKAGRGPRRIGSGDFYCWGFRPGRWPIQQIADFEVRTGMRVHTLRPESATGQGQSPGAGSQSAGRAACAPLFRNQVFPDR